MNKVSKGHKYFRLPAFLSLETLIHNQNFYITLYLPHKPLGQAIPNLPIFSGWKGIGSSPWQ
jgi:hypothetical protein